MKRIFIILGLLILVLNSYGQDLERDNITVDEELIVRDTTIIDLIEEHTSGSSVGAENGLTKTGSNIGLDGTLIRNTEIQGAGYDYELGTSGSKIGSLDINHGGDFTITGDGDLLFIYGGVEWIFDGTYFISELGDTLMTNTLTDSKITAALPYIPFNFEYTYDATITDSRPGPGFFRLNNASYSSVTQIFIDNFDYDNVDKSDFISILDTGSYVTIYDGANYINYQLTGALTAASSYYKYGVTYLNSYGTISGLCDISLDLSNDVGGSGGISDSSWVSADFDTVKINDTKDGYISEYDNTGMIISNGNDEIIFGNFEGDWISLVSNTDTRINIGIGSDVRLIAESGDIVYQNSTNSMEFTGDTLLAEEENIKAKTLYAKDSLFVGDGWITGIDTSNKFTTDTVETNVLVIDKDGTPDTITDGIDAKIAIEAIEFDKLQFAQSYQSYSEGQVYRDTATDAITYNNSVADVFHQLGYEHLVKFYNGTGGTFTDGIIVRAVGSHVNNDINFSADLAGNGSLDSLNGIAMVTASTLTGNHGLATLIGQVNGLNTSAFVDNQVLYMGNAGNYTATKPEAPEYSQIIGRVVYADADSGAIYFYGFSEPSYDPSPIYSASFSDSTITITNPGVNTYALITNDSDSLFGERLNYGFERAGDSVRALQPGLYEVGISYSAYASAAQTDVYEIGVFKNGVRDHKQDRSFSQNSSGGVPFQISISLTTSDWISFRIANTNDAARTSIFTDGVIGLEYITAE